ncbi:PREDICTED: uncharacterized protein LOC105449081 [Wasmannia auropunctata]|uniref:uncharacterized protein LOC105449081 n=1 Tax=Wasmannia auropunctata TaxID=64793 RepID=UPI0005EE3BCD|nr:PREDICTED: uncharacterized protein LOC105449081 [Wasmannia auropunctata]
MTSISYQYLVGVTTACNIIRETCEAIWSTLCPLVLPPALSERDWFDIANDFEELTNFIHCIGAIDGKHVTIQCPNNAGSTYYNYKNAHSVVLMAICDARYLFRFVDIGAYGRRSDGGIFGSSVMGKNFNANGMNVPKPSAVAEGRILPYYRQSKWQNNNRLNLDSEGEEVYHSSRNSQNSDEDIDFLSIIKDNDILYTIQPRYGYDYDEESENDEESSEDFLNDEESSAKFYNDEELFRQHKNEEKVIRRGKSDEKSCLKGTFDEESAGDYFRIPENKNKINKVDNSRVVVSDNESQFNSENEEEDVYLPKIIIPSLHPLYQKQQEASVNYLISLKTEVLDIAHSLKSITKNSPRKFEMLERVDILEKKVVEKKKDQLNFVEIELIEKLEKCIDLLRRGLVQNENSTQDARNFKKGVSVEPEAPLEPAPSVATEVEIVAEPTRKDQTPERSTEEEIYGKAQCAVDMLSAFISEEARKEEENTGMQDEQQPGDRASPIVDNE